MKPWFSYYYALAPGDRSSTTFSAEGVEVTSIDSVDHPLFEKAFSALWSEFGEKAEIEQKEVIERRLKWQGKSMSSFQRYWYQLLWIEKEGVPLGVRDHTVIFHPDQKKTLVHLSHNLLFPDSRRSGLAGWMRAWPLVFARECQREWGVDTPITLVAEMEPLIPDAPDRLPRLLSVEKAGFLKVKGFDYLQPDFRSPQVIDRAGESSSPLAMSLIIRRVSDEKEERISGGELHEMVSALYAMYAVGFRQKEMELPWKRVESINMNCDYSLVKPTDSSPDFT
jgi:hypothetical protein